MKVWAARAEFRWFCFSLDLEVFHPMKPPSLNSCRSRVTPPASWVRHAHVLIISHVQSSHIYLYSTLYTTERYKAALQWYTAESNFIKFTFCYKAAIASVQLKLEMFKIIEFIKKTIEAIGNYHILTFMLFQTCMTFREPNNGTLEPIKI